MAAPLVLARTFADAHRFAREELNLSIGYYRVVNSAGTIKACRNVDIFLVPGWDKRPDRFTMKSALKWCRLNVRDVAAERESAAAFDAAMPPAPEVEDARYPLDERTHTVACRYNTLLDEIPTPEEVASAIENGDQLTIVHDLDAAAEMPEPAEAIEVLAGPSAAPTPVVAEPEAPAKKRRRTKCKQCEQMHIKGEPCIESEDI